MLKSPKPRRRVKKIYNHELTAIQTVASTNNVRQKPRLLRSAHVFNYEQLKKVLHTIDNPPTIVIDDEMRQVIERVRRVKIVSSK